MSSLPLLAHPQTVCSKPVPYSLEADPDPYLASPGSQGLVESEKVPSIVATSRNTPKLPLILNINVLTNVNVLTNSRHEC